MDFEEIRDNIRIAVKNAGGQVKMADEIGVKQSQISDYLTGKTKIENMSLGTLVKFFPDVVIWCFGDAPATGSDFADMEQRLLEYFRRLTPAEKADCLIMFGAKFKESIK